MALNSPSRVHSLVLFSMGNIRSLKLLLLVVAAEGAAVTSVARSCDLIVALKEDDKLDSLPFSLQGTNT